MFNGGKGLLLSQTPRNGAMFLTGASRVRSGQNDRSQTPRNGAMFLTVSHRAWARRAGQKSQTPRNGAMFLTLSLSLRP